MNRFAIVTLSVVLAACGYALVGKENSLSPDIRRIGFINFQNLSVYPDLDRLFSEAVKIEFESRGKYSLVPETTGVDAILTGSIRSVTPVVSGYTAGNLASNFMIEAVASAEFKLVKENKVFWTDTIRVADAYEQSGGTTTAELGARFAQDRNAHERLAKAFAKKLVTSILDAF